VMMLEIVAVAVYLVAGALLSAWMNAGVKQGEFSRKELLEMSLSWPVGLAVVLADIIKRPSFSREKQTGGDIKMECEHDWEPHTVTSNTVVKVRCTNCGKILTPNEISEEKRKEIGKELERKGALPEPVR